MAVSLPSFPSFEVHSDGNAGPRWQKWLSRLERLLIGMNVKDDKQKRALMLHYAGPAVDEIFDTLESTGDDYKTAVEKLTEYFTPQTSTAYEVYNFRQAKQRIDESLDSYHTRLRQLAKTCGFTDIDKEIKEHIILSCHSNSLRRRALREDYSLTDLLKAGRSLEISESQARDVEKNESKINSIQQKNKMYNQARRNYSSFKNNKESNFRRQRPRNADRKKSDSTVCRNCGGSYPHKVSCPAKGKICRSCNKVGHFARVCRTNLPRWKPVNTVIPELDYESEEEYEYVYTVNQWQSKLPPTCLVEIEGQRVTMMIDTGASVNLIDEVTYKLLRRTEQPKKIKNNIYSYGSTKPLPMLGLITAVIKTQSASTTAQLYVVKGNTGNLLSYATAKQLNLFQMAVNSVDGDENLGPAKVFPGLFGGIGKVKGRMIKLHIDPSITPKRQPHRRIPFSVREDVEKELKRLERLDIIEKVEGPTPWVSPIVVVPKSCGEVRICVDMREANRAVKREKHIMPTFDDLVDELNGATVFSKLDLSSGYHQFELSPESRYITTFSTHVGLRRYKRLLFGINAAAEIFQNAIEELLADLPGCKNISDDIVVYGKDQEEHDRNLHGVLQRLNDLNVRLNKEKCVFSQSEIKFYGHVFTARGVKPDPDKVEAIKSMQPPQSVSEVRSLVGMVQYISRFIPDYATITAPLRDLTKKDATWIWGKEQQKALDRLKSELIGSRVMTYFDPRKKTEIIADASPVGLGGMLMQDGKVISYASRALSEVEKRYSQTEREMLAAVWSAEHFHLYVYGHSFSIITDHKPLLGIVNSNKPLSARIERWKLRLMPYNVDLVYRPGKNDKNPADFMSRHPVAGFSAPNLAEEYVNYVCCNAVPKAMTLQEVQFETQQDLTMQALATAIESGQWSDLEVKEYTKVKDELSVHNGTILRGCRLVIPSSLQNKAVDLAHVGHQGIVKTKRLLREKVWFPGIDKLVENKISSCLPCQASSGNPTPPDPLRMTELPSGPWKEVAVDFAGPFPSGDYLMVVIDEYSRFPEVEILTSVSARAVIPKLDAIFARQGIPDVVKSDNGSPFNSLEFKKFAEYLGFQLRRITPYWPKANGEVERFMRTLGKCVKSSCVEGKNWKQELWKFLRQYRATPHTTTDISPSEALNQRKLKISLPEPSHPIHLKSPKITQATMVLKDVSRKSAMKNYADKKGSAKENLIKPGDVVLVKQPKKNKLSTPFNPSPLVVEKKKGTMVTAHNKSKSVTRNSSQFKLIPKHLMKSEPPDEQAEEFPEEIIRTSAPTKAETMSAADQSEEPGQSDNERIVEQTVRRSSRERKMPARFSDYVKY